MQMIRHNRSILVGMALSLLAISLVGCISKNSAPVATAPPIMRPVVKELEVHALCPTIKTFTPAEQKALADAVSKLTESDPIVSVMGDYARMRAEARACQSFK